MGIVLAFFPPLKPLKIFAGFRRFDRRPGENLTWCNGGRKGTGGR
jgi:hypothetical protein